MFNVEMHDARELGGSWIQAARHVWAGSAGLCQTLGLEPSGMGQGEERGSRKGNLPNPTYR